jgi:predicted lipoprotein with Yx(FWY)xxD motif
MTMNTPKILLTAAAMGLAGCAGYGIGPGRPGPGTYVTASVMSSAKAPYGQYLVDGNGRSLYVLADTRGIGGMNRCDRDCLRVWPAAMAARPTVPGAGIDPAKLSTVQGPWGSQLAYDGWPLYYFNRDRGPGETTGQNVRDTWGTWHLLSPSGAPVSAGY